MPAVQARPTTTSEVAGTRPQPPQRLDQRDRVGIVERSRREALRVEVLRRLDGDLAPARRDRRERRAPVAVVRAALDVAELLEPVDDAGHARAVDLEPVAHLPQRQRAGAREVQQHERLVAGEGELPRPQEIVEPGDEDLLRAHDARHGGHGGERRGSPARLPLPRGLLDRVERQRAHAQQGRTGPRWTAALCESSYAPGMCSSESWPPSRLYVKSGTPSPVTSSPGARSTQSVCACTFSRNMSGPNASEA